MRFISELPRKGALALPCSVRSIEKKVEFSKGEDYWGNERRKKKKKDKNRPTLTHRKLLFSTPNDASSTRFDTIFASALVEGYLSCRFVIFKIIFMKYIIYPQRNYSKCNMP